jgi:hypothetical protein
MKEVRNAYQELQRLNDRRNRNSNKKEITSKWRREKVRRIIGK